jgi:hypothetical protein
LNTVRLSLSKMSVRKVMSSPDYEGEVDKINRIKDELASSMAIFPYIVVRRISNQLCHFCYYPVHIIIRVSLRRIICSWKLCVKCAGDIQNRLLSFIVWIFIERMQLAAS